MPEGRIIKALSGYYYVLDGDEIWQCRARGVFKKKGISPLVGDLVEYEQEPNQEGYVMTIQERHSELIRPPIANVDQAVLVFSKSQPSLSPLLLDKFLVHTEWAGVNSIICFSKGDLEAEDFEDIQKIYQDLGYAVVVTDRDDPKAIEILRGYLSGHITVFAGQSGVGKSTLLNILLPGANLLTGSVSDRLKRGKHTTRHVELISVEGGFVADTPGFSQLDFFDIEPEELSSYFIEMKDHKARCKFRGCLHVSEPHCAVLTALAEGRMDPSRYNSYRHFLSEIKEKKRRY